MKDTGRLRRLLAIGGTFVLLGLVGWLWMEPRQFGQGAFTGGLVVALMATVAMARRDRAG